MLLACELIGCSIQNYVGSIEDVVQIINADNTAAYYFAPEYLSQKSAEMIYHSTRIKSIIVIDPLYSADDSTKMRKHIIQEIENRYADKKTDDIRNISWDSFLGKGEDVSFYERNRDRSIPLFTGFTSGTTGIPKGVRHSSETILGIVEQMALVPPTEHDRDSWLLTMASPMHVSVVVSMMCYPLIDGKKLILDPYCNIRDIDLKMMYYQPECWPLAPVCGEILLKSNRIPKEYDMSYFKLFGFGAEPVTTKFIKNIQNFLEMHHCSTPLCIGYGQSEGGSGFTTAVGEEVWASGSVGIPLIDTTISIFQFNTTNELKYNEIGEICKCGAGLMLGYTDEALTKEVMKLHSDGKVWLHTRDWGFMNEEGLLFILGRAMINVYPDKKIFPLKIENIIYDIDGVQDAIIVSGKDEKNIGFECPYLFVVPKKGVETNELLTRVHSLIDKVLLDEERPREVFLIEEKPIKKFKTDRNYLKEKYHL